MLQGQRGNTLRLAEIDELMHFHLYFSSFQNDICMYRIFSVYVALLYKTHCVFHFKYSNKLVASVFCCVKVGMTAHR